MAVGGLLQSLPFPVFAAERVGGMAAKTPCILPPLALKQREGGGRGARCVTGKRRCATVYYPSNDAASRAA